MIKRITVHYKVRAPEERREEIERVNGFHARFCPVARSIGAAIDISTTFELV